MGHREERFNFLEYACVASNAQLHSRSEGEKVKTIPNPNPNPKVKTKPSTFKAPVSFKSGLQSLTAMSTMEAELVAAAFAMKEVIFCTNMMTELGFGSEFRSAPLYIDNIATLNVIGNQTFSGRTKHVALRFFYIRKIVKEGRISIHYVPTEDNLADIETKHLNKQRHKYLIDKIKNFGT